MNTTESSVPVSVIIPAYNIDRYVLECIDSLLSQNISPYEIIVVDDGSTDNTNEVLRQKYGDNPLVKIYRQDNKGAGEARNFGLSVAGGDFIFFCDSDDVVQAGFFAEFRDRLIENPGMEMFCFSSELFFANQKTFPKITHHETGWLKEGKIAVRDLLLGNNYTSAAWTYIVSRRILVDNQLCFLGRVHEDHNITMLAYLLSKEVFRTARVYYSQRVRPGSLTRTRHKFDFGGRINAMQGVIALLGREGFRSDPDCLTIKTKYVNSSLIFLVDACAESYAVLPSPVRDELRNFRHNHSYSFKERFLLACPVLYFYLKKIRLWSKRLSDRGKSDG
ncbi:glycosyltransferase family 2 protein [Methylomonas koyamae]|uniref:glycosyltransferase family 2 protein n=1 Tax=Methylomonas koyamae TaxID=702114 RepID=UPI00112C92B4|nr:glycosyltransferase family A protein [Methylomonas koyamae]TPQ25261.1 hypothetical protein C2U68_15660 [Methylomonas koyamae]